MNTPMPLDAAALDLLHDNHAHDLLGNHPQVIYQARAALTLAARVAELEAANEGSLKAAAYWKGLYERFRDDAHAATAHANALRDALEKGNRRLGYWCDLHGSLPDDVAALSAMQAALAAHPAASLAAYRASVLKEASNGVRSQHTAPHFTEQLRYTIAEGIDALVAKIGGKG